MCVANALAVDGRRRKYDDDSLRRTTAWGSPVSSDFKLSGVCVCVCVRVLCVDWNSKKKRHNNLPSVQDTVPHDRSNTICSHDLKRKDSDEEIPDDRFE